MEIPNYLYGINNKTFSKMKKLSPSKKEKYAAQIDRMKFRLIEIAENLKGEGVQVGSQFQTAGRALEEINKLIERS